MHGVAGAAWLGEFQPEIGFWIEANVMLAPTGTLGSEKLGEG
jgi:hypothetical protein